MDELMTASDINAIMTRLEELGYFKYIDTQGNRKFILDTISENLKHGFLDAFPLDSNDSFSSEKRIYYADEENLAEGSIGEVIKNSKEVLNLEHVRFFSINDVTHEDGTYNLIIDGKIFEIFNHSNIDSPEQWTIAHKRLLEIVNQLLTQAGSKEKLYGQYNGNDGRVIFLTEELFNYLHSLPLNKEWLPYKAESLQI